jgi:hypothetical protein
MSVEDHAGKKVAMLTGFPREPYEEESYSTSAILGHLSGKA